MIIPVVVSALGTANKKFGKWPQKLEIVSVPFLQKI